MACKIVNFPFHCIANVIKKPHKEHFLHANIPRNTLLVYPLELEEDYDLDLMQIIIAMTEYALTEIPDPVGIVPRNVNSTEIIEYTDNELFVKYWVKSDNMITRLTDDNFWHIVPMPSGDLTIVTEEAPNVLSAATFTEHYLLEIIE